MPGVPGLRLAIYPSGRRAYIYRFRDPVTRLKTCLTLCDGQNVKHIDAIKLVWALQVRLAKGLPPKYANMLLGQAYDDLVLPSVLRTSSRSTHASRFDAHIRLPIGNLPLSEITRAVLIALIDQLRPSRKCRRAIVNLKPSTRNRVVDELKFIFRKLYELGLIEENIAKDLQKIPERNQRTRILRDEEQARFFTALGEAPIKTRLLISLLLLTGMRIGEALSTRWDYVDLANRTIRLPDTKSGRPRVVPLSAEACSICEQLRAMRTNVFLFPGRGDGPMSRPSRQIKAMLAAAGMEGFWPHDLRRHYATRIAEILPTHAVSAILGHSSTAVTERYLVATDLRLHDAADSIGRQLAPLISGKTL